MFVPPRYSPVAAAILATLLAAPLHARNLSPEVTTLQAEIVNGQVPFNTLFYRGAHIFTNKFTTEDGYGEAAEGPRRRHLSIAGGKTPFLRFNGLDAQSCFECHAAAGMETYAGGLTMPREPGTVGGNGGSAANVFIFENFNNLTDGIVRNPPHAFGLGYVQQLATEMTHDLHHIRDTAIEEAEATQTPVRVELVSKGTKFGFITVTPLGFTDMSEVEGVSIDLVVRPFQFKGIASSIRNFVTGAMNFHFSVQAEELVSRFLIPNDNPENTIPGDELYEILPGEITTVSVFVAAMRPPMTDTTGLDVAQVERGRALFTAIGCGECHTPSLRMDDPKITIIDPDKLPEPSKQWLAEAKSYVSITDRIPSMVAAEPDSSRLGPVIEYAAKKAGKTGPGIGYSFDLNSPDLPDEALPRLPYNADKSVDVPLFSDLKRHRMGTSLADTRVQATDVASLFVAAEEFLTRPLWGVADTGPWLHDGRALSLEEAILMHEGNGSEANDSVTNFRVQSVSDRQAVVEFLRSLRVRTANRSMEPNKIDREGFYAR